MGNICFNDCRGHSSSHGDGVEDHYSSADYVDVSAILVGQGSALTELGCLKTSMKRFLRERMGMKLLF